MEEEFDGLVEFSPPMSFPFCAPRNGGITTGAVRDSWGGRDEEFDVSIGLVADFGEADLVCDETGGLRGRFGGPADRGMAV